MGIFDEKYGRCLGCIPTKIFVTGFVAYLFVTGMVELISWTVYAYKNEGQLDSSVHHHGYVSCVGMKDASFHLRFLVEIAGSALMGTVGLVALLDNCGRRLYQIYVWLLVVAAVRVVSFVWDLCYTRSCYAYSTNMMESAVFWGTRGAPVEESRKRELERWASYDVAEVNDFIGWNMYWLWGLDVVLSLLVIAYVAYVFQKFCEFFTLGEAGMGEFIGLQNDATDPATVAKEQFGSVKFEDHPLLKQVDVFQIYAISMTPDLMVKPEGKFAS